MKRELLFCVGMAFNAHAAIAQDRLNQASYTPETKVLKIPVVQVGNVYYAAELIDQGEYQFKLQRADVYVNAIPQEYSSFDLAKGGLLIPNLLLAGKLWQVKLQHRGNMIFTLASAVEQPSVGQSLPAPETQPELASSKPEERYTINNDGTVTDNATHLQWMRCSLGQTWDGKTCQGNLLKLSMQGAAYAAFQTKFAGKTDWRLPNVDELKTLVYCSTGSPAYWNTSGRACEGAFAKPTLYSAAFPDTPSGVYWTSTNLQADPGEDYNLTVSFNYGHVYYSYFNDAYEFARFVRGESNIVVGPEYIGGFKE